SNVMPTKTKRRRVRVAEARRLLAQEEAQKLVDMEEVVAQAIRRVENSGIIFLDELDKVAGREGGHGPDVSREGVQRDLLPIAESAMQGNTSTENIGARRLYTIMERLLEDVSFEAPDMPGKELTIDAEYVRQRLSDVMRDQDLSRYIL